MSHWKSLFDYKHLGCQDLPRDAENKPLDIVVTILKLEKRDITVENGRKENVPVADLKGVVKPMILNKTNLGLLAELFGSSEYEDFIGKPFILYAAKVKGKGGGIVDGLRIRPEKPPEKQLTVLDSNHPKYEGAKKSLKSGDVTIERLRQSFSISPEVEKDLNS